MKTTTRIHENMNKKKYKTNIKMFLLYSPNGCFKQNMQYFDLAIVFNA